MMAPRMGGTRIGYLLLLCGAALTVLPAPPASAADPPPCRVRNVTQDTKGRSLIRMVEKAVDGDELLVRGTCPGRVRIESDIAIVGSGETPILTGHGRTLVIKVTRRATVTLRGLVIRHGRAQEGGGIFVSGALTLVDSVVRRNTANVGGGIFIDPIGTATVIDSVVRRNVGLFGAGGMVNYGDLTLMGSTIRRNTANGGGGGAIVNERDLTLIGSTVRGNTARRQGGGIFNTGTLTLTDSTVTGNASRMKGGGIFNESDLDAASVVVLEGTSSVTGNTPDDCAGTTAC
jgi:predicted outer membrane repeat protein